MENEHRTPGLDASELRKTGVLHSRVQASGTGQTLALARERESPSRTQSQWTRLPGDCFQMIIEKLQSSAKRRERYKAIEALRLVCKPWRAMLQERLDSLECLWPSGMDIVQMPPVTQFSRLRRLEVAIDTDTGDGWSYHSVPTEFDISSVAALRHLTHLTITTSSPEGFLEIHCSLLPQSVQDINLRNMKLKAGRDFCLPNAKRLQFHAPGISYEDSLTGLPSFLANMPNLKELDIYGRYVEAQPDVDAEVLLSIFRSTSLTSLVLQSLTLVGQLPQELDLAISVLRVVTMLDMEIEGTMLNPILSRLTSLSRLESDCHVQPGGLSPFPLLPPSARILELHGDYNSISFVGEPGLHFFKLNQSSSRGLTEPEQIASIARMTALTKLELCNVKSGNFWPLQNLAVSELTLYHCYSAELEFFMPPSYNTQHFQSLTHLRIISNVKAEELWMPAVEGFEDSTGPILVPLYRELARRVLDLPRLQQLTIKGPLQEVLEPNLEHWRSTEDTKTKTTIWSVICPAATIA